MSVLASPREMFGQPVPVLQQRRTLTKMIHSNHSVSSPRQTVSGREQSEECFHLEPTLPTDSQTLLALQTT